MKRNSIISSLIGLTLCVPLAVFAVPGQIGSWANLADRIKDFAWQVFALIAVIMFIIAGVLFLTAQGEAEKLTKARSAFMWGVAGVVVGIVAYSILYIVGSFLGTGI